MIPLQQVLQVVVFKIQERTNKLRSSDQSETESNMHREKDTAVISYIQGNLAICVGCGGELIEKTCSQESLQTLTGRHVNNTKLCFMKPMHCLATVQITSNFLLNLP